MDEFVFELFQSLAPLGAWESFEVPPTVAEFREEMQSLPPGCTGFKRDGILLRYFRPSRNTLEDMRGVFLDRSVLKTKTEWSDKIRLQCDPELKFPFSQWLATAWTDPIKPRKFVPEPEHELPSNLRNRFNDCTIALSKYIPIDLARASLKDKDVYTSAYNYFVLGDGSLKTADEMQESLNAMLVIVTEFNKRAPEDQAYKTELTDLKKKNDFIAKKNKVNAGVHAYKMAHYTEVMRVSIAYYHECTLGRRRGYVASDSTLFYA